MSRMALIITALIVGAVFAVGATFAATSLISAGTIPTNQSSYNYGG